MVDHILQLFPSQQWFLDVLNSCDNNILNLEFIKLLSGAIYNEFSARNAHCDSSNVLNLYYILAWENINKGMYKDVPESWRKVYGLICLLRTRAIIQQKADGLKDALYFIDMALLIGGPLAVDSNPAADIGKAIHMALVEQKPFPVERVDRSLLNYTFTFDPYDSVPVELKLSVVPLRRIRRPSIKNFIEIARGIEPVILLGCMDHWPALSTRRWSIEYVRSRCGYRTVPIEIGTTYASDEWTQRLMTINEFIDMFFYGQSMSTNNIPLSTGYLAQHYLLDQVTELSDDVVTPDYCYADPDGDHTEVDINGWFGPAGTVSPLHQDPKPNLLCQVFGSKYVKLYPSNQSDFLYPHTFTMLKNTSKIDVLRPDLTNFPSFAYATGWDGTLEPGEMLFIPERCWHYVQSLSPSFSVNFWWSKMK